MARCALKGNSMKTILHRRAARAGRATNAVIFPSQLSIDINGKRCPTCPACPGPLNGAGERNRLISATCCTVGAGYVGKAAHSAAYAAIPGVLAHVQRPQPVPYPAYAFTNAIQALSSTTATPSTKARTRFGVAHSRTRRVFRQFGNCDGESSGCAPQGWAADRLLAALRIIPSITVLPSWH
jgi:hypothetical protein